MERGFSAPLEKKGAEKEKGGEGGGGKHSSGPLPGSSHLERLSSVSLQGAMRTGEWAAVASGPGPPAQALVTVAPHQCWELNRQDVCGPASPIRLWACGEGPWEMPRHTADAPVGPE